MKRSLLLVALCLLCSSYSRANNTKDIQWQTGTLTDVAVSHSTQTRGNAHGSVNQGTGSMHGTVAEIAVTTNLYTIDAGNVIYVLRQTVRGNGKSLNVTQNTQVKFGTKGDKYYMLDESGKAHEVFLEKKAAKTAPESPQPKQ